MRRVLCLTSLAGLLIIETAGAQENGWTATLLAEEAPAARPWEDGATLSLKSVDGKTTAVADAVLKVDRLTYRQTDSGYSRTSWGPGAYIHRQTDPTKPTNDRGVLLSGGGLWVDNGPASGARTSWGWSVDAKFGRKLITETRDGTSTQHDKTAARAVAGAEYVYTPSVSGVPQPGVPRLYWYVSGSGKLYVDRLSGGSGPSGHVSGAEFGIRVDVAPLGLDPANAMLGGTKLGVVPTVGIYARAQNDMSASSGRTKDDRTLYGIKIQFAFARLDGAGPVPGITLERSIGADLLTARSDSGVTKLALSLKY